MVYKVPVNRPTRTDREPSYMHEALARGQLSGDGPYTRRCHALLEESLGVHKVHASPFVRKLGIAVGDCPVTVRVSDRLVRLPFHTDMTDAEQSEVIAAVSAVARV